MAQSQLTVTLRVADVDQWKAVLEAASNWLPNYDEVEDYGNGNRGCTQFDNGYEEYEARMDLIVALRALAAAHVELEPA
jgi:hypothetical protein